MSHLVLLVTAAHAGICPPEFSEEIHRLIPASQLEIFEDSSHSARVDAPERMMQVIREFLAG